jgi:transposase-like protein
MDTLLLPEAGRRRRRYSAEFKLHIVTACLQPGVSTTAIALENKINPNLVRRWIRLRQDSQAAELAETEVVEGMDVGLEARSGARSAPALIPVTLAEAEAASLPLVPAVSRTTGAPAQRGRRHQPLPSPALASPPPPAGQIRLELRRGKTLLNVEWPAMQAESCALWLRELLR